MVNKNGGFIAKSSYFDKLFMQGVVIFQCQFEPRFYDDTLYPQFDIEMSNQISGAIRNRKAEYLAGRYCAKEALKRLKISDFNLLSDDNRCPIWPVDVKGSITHCGLSAMAAVSLLPSIKGLGIDMENIVPIELIDEIKQEIIFENEFALLNAYPYSEELIFTLIFSIKESFFKAVFPLVNYYFGFDAVCVDKLNFHEQRFELELRMELTATLSKGRRFSGLFCIDSQGVVSLFIV